MNFWWWHSYTWFPDSASPICASLQEFYDGTMFFIFFTGFLVAGSLIFVLTTEYSNTVLYGSQYAEAAWTTIPIFVLLYIGNQSLNLLYAIDEVVGCRVTFKILGHQWYWTYEYTDNGNIKFDSYIIEDNDLPLGGHRISDVDNRVVLPVGINIRAITLGIDVIHSWAVPALGFKLDCIPGRLNQAKIIADRTGVYYGQCSELCGVNHAFMPIVVEFISPEDFGNWVEEYNEDY